MNDQSLKKKVQVVVIANAELLLFEFNSQIANNYVGFQNITGGVEGEESFYEAAVRELVEEAGITASVIDLNLEFTFHDRWKKNCLERVYLCHLNQKPEIVLNEEHLHCKWVALNKVTESDYTFPNNYKAFLSAKKFIEGLK